MRERAQEQRAIAEPVPEARFEIVEVRHGPSCASGERRGRVILANRGDAGKTAASPRTLDARGEDGVWLALAAAAVRRGEVLAVATDTFYALAADPFAPGALDRLFRLKGRDEGKPLLLLVDGAARVESVCARTPPLFPAAAEAFWPGPLTLLVPARPGLPAGIVGSGGAVAVRTPAAPAVLALSRAVARPLTGTSANPSGVLPPRDAAAVQAVFAGRAEQPGWIVDSGPSPGGLPSTILDLTSDPPRVVREGAVPRAEIEARLNIRTG